MSPWLETLSPDDRRVLNHSDILTSDCDVLVVGGGLLGLATAYFLAERKVTVQVIAEEPRLGAGSEHGTGALWPSAFALRCPDVELHELAQQGRDQWAKFAVRPEFSFDWRVNGLLELSPLARDETAVERANRALELGCSVTTVDAEQIAQLEPRVMTDWASRGGLHFPSEAQGHPVKAAVSLVRACRKRGVKLASGVTFTAVQHGNRIVGATTSQGELSFHSLAVTNHASSLLKPGMHPPPVTGTSVGFATSPQPPLLKVGLLADYPLVQLRSGDLVTSMPIDQPPRIPAGILAELGSVEWTRIWSVAESVTVLPHLFPDATNAWLTNCGIKDEFLLAPALGRLLADKIGA